MSSNNPPPLPPGRTWEQLRNHFEVEREIAAQLKSANREERKGIYATMYDDLFARVPDHSRLQIRDDAIRSKVANQVKWSLVKPFLEPEFKLIEFAPGSCKFSVEVCPHVREVVGIDISDQTGGMDSLPENFHLVIYDGYDLDYERGSADMIFSDQLLEHFHPDDTELHLSLAKDLLKPGGLYLFRTPHRHSGPHDVSAWFTDGAPEGFHLKEWTYTEFDEVLARVGFSSWRAYRLTKGCLVPIPMILLKALEKWTASLQSRQRVPMSLRLYKNIVLAART